MDEDSSRGFLKDLLRKISVEDNDIDVILKQLDSGGVQTRIVTGSGAYDIRYDPELTDDEICRMSELEEPDHWVDQPAPISELLSKIKLNSDKITNLHEKRLLTKLRFALETAPEVICRVSQATIHRREAKDLSGYEGSSALTADQIGLFEAYFVNEAEREFDQVKSIVQSNVPLLRHGGRRRTELWSEEDYINFYRSHENLKNRVMDGNRQDIWKVARQIVKKSCVSVDEFIQDARMTEVPKDLLREAYSVWCRADSGSRNLKPDERPSMFRLRHALRLAEIPDKRYVKNLGKQVEYKPDTLTKYCDKGRKLCEKVSDEDSR